MVRDMHNAYGLQTSKYWMVSLPHLVCCHLHSYLKPMHLGALDKMLLQSYQGTPILLFPFQSRIDMSEIVPLKTVEESFFGWVGLV